MSEFFFAVFRKFIIIVHTTIICFKKKITVFSSKLLLIYGFNEGKVNCVHWLAEVKSVTAVKRFRTHCNKDTSHRNSLATLRSELFSKFLDRQIRRGKPISWPLQSPDLTPLDFFPWAHVKTTVYSNSQPRNTVNFLFMVQ